MADPVDQYAIEQAKLRNKHGLEPEGGDEEDIHIDAPLPDLPAINPEVFKDVEPILLRGFLHVHAEIHGVKFVFKSLNHHEFEQLNLMSRGGDYKAVQAFYNRFLAFGVFMVDGINVLPDRDAYIADLSDFFHDLSEQSRKKVVFELSQINRRAVQAVVLTEAYAMENVSRLRWAQVHGLDLTSTAITGVEGTPKLGMNWGQLAWRAINYFEDAKELAEREWENAKFVASAMAGKGMSRVYSQDKQRRKSEAEEKATRRDKILRLAILGEDGAAVSSSNGAIKVARTVEELALQLERDLKNEKDWHDSVVDAYEQRIQQERVAHSEYIQKLREGHEAMYGDVAVTGTTSLEGLDPRAIEERVARKRQIMAQQIASRQVLPEFHDPKVGTFMDKWHGPVEGVQKVRTLSVPKPPKGDV